MLKLQRSFYHLLNFAVCQTFPRLKLAGHAHCPHFKVASPALAGDKPLQVHNGLVLKSWSAQCVLPARASGGALHERSKKGSQGCKSVAHAAIAYFVDPEALKCMVENETSAFHTFQTCCQKFLRAKSCQPQCKLIGPQLVHKFLSPARTPPPSVDLTGQE